MSQDRDYSRLGHLVVIAGDYPAPEHIRLVFVQQFVEAMLDRGATISVIAPQSIIHAIVHKESLLPRSSHAKSKNGGDYFVYRPYYFTFGNHKKLEHLFKVWNDFILKRTLKKIKPNIIYAHFWSSALLVNSYALVHKIPLFVACGEGDDAMEEMVQSLSDNEFQALRDSVAGVISVSSANRNKCIDYHLINPDRIEVFPNCVDINLFQQRNKKESRLRVGAKDDDFVIVFVGGFIPRKGPDRLAKAITQINDPSIKVIFIGKAFPGYPFDFDCPGILYKGPVNHDELPVFLSAADIFVLPTQKEGCCNAIIEALSIGLPVISSEGSFNDDILNVHNSLRVNPDDVTAIKEAILMLKNNPSYMQQMSEESLKQRNKYSIYQRAQNVLDYISDINSSFKTFMSS